MVKSRSWKTPVVACLLAVVALAASASRSERLRQLRGELGLVAGSDALETLPPEAAFTQIALGSLRGVLVDFLWVRMERLRRQGRHVEVLQLADWLTRLQPRFSRVWEYHAWNLAYNVPATLGASEERWRWVQAGISLLRDEALRRNPDDVELHEELGWIFLHKIGRPGDPSHRFYKRRLATTWQTILGAPSRGDVARQIAEFAPIVEAYERYVNREAIDRALAVELDALARVAAGSLSDGQLHRLGRLRLGELAVELERIVRELGSSATPEVANALARLRASVDERRDLATLPLRERVARHWPRGAELLQQLRQLRGDLDLRLLETVRDLEEARADAPDSRDPGSRGDDARRRLESWLRELAVRERERLVALAQALVLSETHNMDPLWMHELLSGRWLDDVRDGSSVDTVAAARLPLDWRHPAAHSLYWSTAGMRRARARRRFEPARIVEHEHQALLALELLASGGRVRFDRRTGQYNLLPEPSFIAAYDWLLHGAAIGSDGEPSREAIAERFRQSYENHLVRATLLHAVRGESAQASRFYDRLRRLYGEGSGRLDYDVPLETFVEETLREGRVLQSPDEARLALHGLLRRAVVEGYLGGHATVAERFIEQARELHRQYHARRDAGAAEWLALPPVDRLLVDVYADVVESRDTVNDVGSARRLWNNTPAWLQREARPSLRPRLRELTAGLDESIDTVFPPPE